MTRSEGGASLVNTLHTYRRPLVVGIHLVMAAVSYYVAIWLRFEGEVPPEQAAVFLRIFPWLIAIRGLVFIPFRLYEGLWRYASIWDLRNIVAAVATGSVAGFIVIRWGLGIVGYSRSVVFIDTVVLIIILGGLRLTRRIHRELGRLDREKRVLIYGAGDAGEMIARDMRNNPYYDYEPVGFVDDDSTKVGQRIHGVKVLGTRESLATIMEETRPAAVLVAIARAEPGTIRGIVRALEPFKVPIQTLPNLRDILDGKVAVSQIRTLAIEDLLARAPVGLDPQPLQRLIEGRRVLVTGAGGSIGSELSRQIAPLRPERLVLVDRYENGLHAVAGDLGSRWPLCRAMALVADVGDGPRVGAILGEHHPQIVFHAAAHKHVPLMELNPCEAVLNNVRATRVLLEAAGEAGVERFILISTDKAVNPASVMGATKRVGELMVQTLGGRSAGAFAAVRFGNVLGSNGSVVPHFLNQIRAGGPVTVTHPEMRRYFMLIPEAVGLVLHAATLAREGGIFVLEMGEQIRVLDLARNLIRLSGLVPGEDIAITFTGLRLGEKLFEELAASDEQMEPSPVPGILRIRSGRPPERDLLMLQIEGIERLAMAGDAKAVIERLQDIVPTYVPR